jgi:sodium/hydrogen antiporter
MLDPSWFEAYDALLLFTGAGLLLITLGRRLFERLNLSSSYIYLAIGILAGPALLDLAPGDPLDAVPLLRRLAEAAVIIGLAVLGLRIGRPLSWRGWRSTTRLILLVKPASITGLTAAGMWLLDLPLGPAVVLAAVLAPTDPILAGPLEQHDPEDQSEDRFGLSSEAGINDGFAFPFVYLGIHLTVLPGDWQAWGLRWLLLDLLYAVGAALPLGWLAGHACGRLYDRLMHRDGVSHKRRLFVPLALLLFAYGLVELLGAYGFLGVFAAGLAFRRAVPDVESIRHFADFTESLDELAKAALLILFGALLPWPDMLALGWPGLAFALLLILVLRPGLVMLATVGGAFRMLDRVYWSWFGIRGIGSMFYLAFALDHGVEGPLAHTIFAATGVVVLASLVLHGLSVRPFLERFEGMAEVEE